MHYVDNWLLLLQSMVAIFALIILYMVWWNSGFKSFVSKHKQPPQPFFTLPVIGHLHLFLNIGQPLYRKLGDMADKLGPAFMLRFGSRRTLVISSWDVVKECFTINDKGLSARPSTAITKYMCYDSAMYSFAPYGSYWRSIGKFTNTEFLSNTRLDNVKHIMLAEIETCLKELHTLCECDTNNNNNNNNNNRSSVITVNMKEWFGDLSFNVVLQMVAGKRFFGSGSASDEARRFRKATHQFFHLLFVSVPSDMFPWLEWVDLGGHVKTMKAAAKEMDSVMVWLMEEHRERRTSGVAAGDADFMDVMLSIVGDDHELRNYFDQETLIKATSLVQTELDEKVGKDRVVNESDIKNLIYLQAVIKESFRLTPPGELLVPRETVHDCVVAGFHIPTGTQVIVNAWKLQRDPHVWPNPLEFQPERFLPSHAAAGIDVKGQNYELIPFGSGRRLCPGISMAQHVLHLTLARLIQGFELRPEGNVPAEIYEGLFSVSSYSAPLMVEITPRLSPELYQP
ncbi:putative cytochrome P450 [Dioscorea sansibarensis]